MRSRPLLVAVLCTAATAAPLAAQTTASPGRDSVALLPSVALPPELDRVLRDYEERWRAGDAAALARLFAEDGFVLQGGRPPVRGRAAIEAAYAGHSGGPLRLRALAYAASDTVGYIIGAYGYGDDADLGKFTLTLRRSRGARWLVFSDMDNMSRRPRGPGPAAGGASPP